MFGLSAANLLADSRCDKILALLSLSELLIHGWMVMQPTFWTKCCQLLADSRYDKILALFEF